MRFDPQQTGRFVGPITLAALFLLVLLSVGSSWITHAGRFKSPAFDLVVTAHNPHRFDRLQHRFAETFTSALLQSCRPIENARFGVLSTSASPTLAALSPAGPADLTAAALEADPTSESVSDLLARAQQQLQSQQRPDTRQVVLLLVDEAETEAARAARAEASTVDPNTEFIVVSLHDAYPADSAPSRSLPTAQSTVFPLTDAASFQTSLAEVANRLCQRLPAYDFASLPADIMVVQRPLPNTRVAPGDTLTSDVVVRNTGMATADFVEIVAPFDATRLALLDVTFGNPAVWQTGRSDAAALTITTERLAPGDVLTATLRFRVLPELITGTVISQTLQYAWANAGGADARSANRVTLQVADTAEQRAVYDLSVEPRSSARRPAFTFTGTVFSPFEPVGIWINLPDGTTQTVTTRYADADGRLELDYTADAQLANGAYTIVFFGHLSEFTAVGPFAIQR